MSEDTLDQRLHAFLDERLSPEERREIEARLRDDPELAARLEHFREIGVALRDGDATPPAGFYNRARARFEAQAGGGASAPRTWFRPLSWESLGVAAAAVLALAVFVPLWQNGNSPLESSSAAIPESSADTVAPAAPSLETKARAEAEPAPSGEVTPSGAPARAAAKPVRDDNVAQRQQDGEQAEFKDTAPADGFVQGKRGTAPSVAEERAPTSATDTPASSGSVAEALAAEPRARSNEGDRAQQDVDESEFARKSLALNDMDAVAQDDTAAGAAQPPPVQQSPAPKVESEKEGDATEPVPNNREEQLATLLELAKTGEPFSTNAMLLPLVGHGEVLVLDDLAALGRAEDARDAARADTSEGAAATAPAKGDTPEIKDEKKAQRKKDKTRVRWVLIGPRDRPFACGGFKISSEGDVWVIGLSAPAADQEPAVHGCVLTLPPGTQPVRVTGP